MFWVCGIVILVSIGLGYFLWPKTNRSFHLAATSGLTIGGIALLGIYVTQLWPVEHIQYVVKKYVEPPKVIYRDRPVYRDPNNYLKNVNAQEVCKGSRPVKVLSLLYNSESDGSNSRTYVKAEPVGTGVTILCEVRGDLTATWQVGEIIQMTSGSAY